jgi:acyl-CoA reductase-like NAD-dependent aldehyde dehydrogenase
MNIPIALDRSRLDAALAELSFGGTRQSGLGRKLGRNAVADYTEEISLHFRTGPRTARCVPIRQSGAA